MVFLSPWLFLGLRDYSSSRPLTFQDGTALSRVSLCSRILDMRPTLNFMLRVVLVPVVYVLSGAAYGQTLLPYHLFICPEHGAHGCIMVTDNFSAAQCQHEADTRRLQNKEDELRLGKPTTSTIYCSQYPTLDEVPGRELEFK